MAYALTFLGVILRNLISYIVIYPYFQEILGTLRKLTMCYPIFHVNSIDLIIA